MASRISKLGLQVYAPSRTEGEEAKLFVRQGRIEVKVEINQVLRGTIHPVVSTRMVPVARDQLKADLRLPVLAPEELYGGKLVAALDRNHPRDWFDVMLLLKHEGITASIRRCFVAYLAAHNRPPHEVLFGPTKSLTDSFDREFLGMTSQNVSLAELEEVGVRGAMERKTGLGICHRLASQYCHKPDRRYPPGICCLRFG
jgi:hypothetical protein